MPSSGGPGVWVGACLDEHAYNLRAAGEVAGPVGSRVRAVRDPPLSSGIRSDARLGWSLRSRSSAATSPARIARMRAPSARSLPSAVAVRFSLPGR